MCEYLHTWIFLAGLLSKQVMPALQAVLRPVAQPQGSKHVLFEHFWVEAGEQPLPEPSDRPNFVMTTSVKGHLRNLARAALVRRFPVLLQASTCSPVFQNKLQGRMPRKMKSGEHQQAGD